MSDWKEEYREAGQNFREGTKLMFDISKGLITIHTFLFAAYAVVRNFHETPDSSSFSLSIFLICVVGILASIGFIVAHWRMSQYLRRFLIRATEIEEEQNFKLFTKISEYNRENDHSLFNNEKIPLFGFGIIGLVWVILFIASMGILKLNINL